jgi:hypothetical protein
MSELQAYQVTLNEVERLRQILRRIASIAMLKVNGAQHAKNIQVEAEWKMISDIAKGGIKQ